MSRVFGEKIFVTERKIPVACVQARAADRAEFSASWPRILGLADEAGRSGAKLIVLPEATVPGYVLGSEPVAQELIERTRSELADVARRHEAVIVYGTARLEGKHQYNTAEVLGPDGRELGWAAKQFLWHFDRLWFAPGATLDPIDTPLGRLGVLVCADGRIPTIAGTLVERGAEMLVMPTAWVTSGRDPANLENIQADLFVNVRAHENAVPFAGANKAGIELESVAYCGKSAIVDAAGRFVARGNERDETIVSGEVTLLGRAPEERPALKPRAVKSERPKGRIAFTLAHDSDDVERFAKEAAQADADLLVAYGDSLRVPEVPIVSVSHGSGEEGEVVECGGFALGIVRTATLRNPRGLVEARLAGVDIFVWHAGGAPEWNVPYARTRAAELRAYVIVLDRSNERAFAVDPDGVVIAGTFEAYRLAAFPYDRARTGATAVAPSTDVFQGLRTAETIRSRRAAAVR